MATILETLHGKQRERNFQLHARIDAVGVPAVWPAWKEPVFITCTKCARRATRQNWASALYVCLNCGNHQPIGAYYRLSLLLDHGTFKELNQGVQSKDCLDFPEYAEKLVAQQKKTGLQDAVVTAVGKIENESVVVCVMDSRFLMGSMGAGVGEKITLAVEYAVAKKLPLIIYAASGGARMQEGIVSLMQMAKTSAAIAAFSAQGGLYISVLTHPTTGGVTASFASLGDITLAEPGALVGFAGPRVIEQTIGQKLPEGFQRSEYLEAHGFVDQIVSRSQHRTVLGQLLRLHANKQNRMQKTGGARS